MENTEKWKLKVPVLYGNYWSCISLH